MDLKVFLKESTPDPLTMVTLRGRVSSLGPTDSAFLNEIEAAVVQEKQPKNELVLVSSII
jgi:hypothetical protein